MVQRCKDKLGQEARGRWWGVIDVRREGALAVVPAVLGSVEKTPGVDGKYNNARAEGVCEQALLGRGHKKEQRK